MSLDVSTVVEKYIALRDKRSALKKAYDEQDGVLKAAMEKMDAWLLRQCNDLDVDNLSIKGVGTVIRGRDMKVGGKDWPVFNRWAKDHDQLDMFERRISRTVLKAYMEENNDDIPPGLNVVFEQTVTVRRATATKETK